MHALVARSTFGCKNDENTTCSDHFCTLKLRVSGARDSAPCQKGAKRVGFATISKTLVGIGHLKGMCKDALRVAGAVPDTHESDMLMLGGPGADFLRRSAFWSISSSGSPRWFCMTGAAVRMTWHHFFETGAVL